MENASESMPSGLTNEALVLGHASESIIVGEVVT